jgi:hypothetical protein
MRDTFDAMVQSQHSIIRHTCNTLAADDLFPENDFVQGKIFFFRAGIFRGNGR